MAKADENEKVKEEFRDLYELLKTGFLEEKLVVPQSWFHDVETSLAPVLKERIVSYQNYLGQISLQRAEHVRNYQTARFLQRFLGDHDVDPFETSIAFHDDPDKRVEQFNINVNSDLTTWGFESSRAKTATDMEDIRQHVLTNKVTYDEQLEKEVVAQRDHFFTDALKYYSHLCTDPRQNLLAFGNDPVFRTIPINNIYARLWSWLFTKYPTRTIKTGDATDIDVLSTYLPYMDIVATDHFMTTQVRALGIDKEHDVTVFSAKTRELEDFCDYLNDYLASTQPANHPLITVFVLPTPSVKQDAFKLFHALGRSTFRLKKPAFAHIYGFDDGNMPEYELPQIPGTPVPFYGLQEVHVITIKPTTSAEEVLTLCRRNCRSEQFVIIHEYQTLADDFIVAASMSAEAGQEQNSSSLHP